jgi:hypothetical protein
MVQYVTAEGLNTSYPKFPPSGSGSNADPDLDPDQKHCLAEFFGSLIQKNTLFEDKFS